MIETREKNIEGSNYSVTQLPARRAIRLKARLLKLFGPVVAQLFISASDKTSDFEKKHDVVRAVEIFAQNIEENSFENLVTELLSGVRKNGMELTPQTIDMEFAGDMATLYQVMWFVLETNFDNFFQLIGIGNLTLPEQPIPMQTTTKAFTRK